MKEFFSLYRPVIAVSIAVSFNTILLILTIYFGRLNKRTMFHKSHHELCAYLFLFSVVITGIVVEAIRPHDHAPWTIFTYVHLLGFVLPFSVVLVLLVTKIASPRRFGSYHYILGIACALLFAGVLITGYAVYATKTYKSRHLIERTHLRKGSFCKSLNISSMLLYFLV